MEEKYKCIDRCIKKDKVVKISCRNSYERLLIHKYAKNKGVASRSIVNYNKAHINQNIEQISNSGCCYDCDRFEMTITTTPHSFVEINNGYKKLIIGDPNIVLGPWNYYYYGNTSHSVSSHKRKIKEQCLKILCEKYIV